MNPPKSPYQFPSRSPVREVLPEGTFDGSVVGLFSGDNDDRNVKPIVKSSGIDYVESREGGS